MIDLETAGRILGSLHDTRFTCPHCGHPHEASESETAQYVVTFWGEDDHDFICEACDQNFVVREMVMRSFIVGKTTEEVEAQ